MNSKEQMLSVAEVCELQAGDADNATWINPGFQGVVRKIDQRNTKAGKKMWPCVIADTTGSATLEVTFFTAPKFGEGDLLEFSGQGLRRTEYNGKPQAAIGQKTEVHVLGKSVHHEEQVERAATGQPAINGTAQPVIGPTVGMAINNAMETLRHTYGVEFKAALKTPAFWAEVHELSSDIIRVSRLLEHGKLAEPIRERVQGKTEPAAKAPAAKATGPRAKPTHDQLANVSEGEGEDVAF